MEQGNLKALVATLDFVHINPLKSDGPTHFEIWFSDELHQKPAITEPKELLPFFFFSQNSGRRLYKMSDAGSETASNPPAETTEVEVAETKEKSGPMSVEDALQEVIKTALVHDGLARGLRECAKALDKREAHLCVLVETVTEGMSPGVSLSRICTRSS